MTEGFIDKIRPTFRDVLAASAGAVGGAYVATRGPRYVEGVMDRYQKKQAESYREMMRQELSGILGGKRTERSDGQAAKLDDLVFEMRQSRDAYKSLEAVVSKLSDKIEGGK